MLHKKAYQEFMTLLNQWQKICTVSQSTVEPTSEMTKQFPQLQQCFKQEITTLTDEELNMKVISSWRSLHTEIKREFRLLSTDMLFLASSRQTSTRDKRLKIICDRNTKLIVYCQKILETLTNY
ncbi:MAG: heterocyst frequency control protein PatD [Xenococcaceae cyanobacterium MO_188.B19]|nr:heterocyst frequency control protein PatD [Xenococcaceae cyanobacterium MO_188.B19]